MLRNICWQHGAEITILSMGILLVALITKRRKLLYLNSAIIRIKTCQSRRLFVAPDFLKYPVIVFVISLRPKIVLSYVGIIFKLQSRMTTAQI